MANRVVVTGIGCVSAVGHSLDALWEAAIHGRTGIKRISLFDTTDFDVHIAADIPDWDPAQYMDARVARRCDRFVQFAVAAADQALADAGLEVGGARDDMGGVIGPCIGGMETGE